MALSDRVVLLTGGVGGVKLAYGLAQILPPEALTIIVNTGDDFEHLSLTISPDLDTVKYTLAGMSDPGKGWGLSGDTFKAMTMVGRLGGPTWFNLGDSDLGTGLIRTSLRDEGWRLTKIETMLAKQLGIRQRILPMTDDTVQTMLLTDQGILSFQSYFVREGWQPVVSGIIYQGAELASATPEVLDALNQATLIILGPSNPYLSIDPILAINDIASILRDMNVPVVCMNPIISGAAVKGPTAKLMTELGEEVTPLTVAEHYAGIISGIFIDSKDRAYFESLSDLGLNVGSGSILMTDVESKIRCAQELLAWVTEAFA